MTTSDRRGFVYVLSLIFLSLLASLAITIAMVSDSGSAQAYNYTRMTEARNNAESGLSFALRELSELRLNIASGIDEEEAWGELILKMGDALNGTTNLGGGDMYSDDDTIVTPVISLDAGGQKRFRLQIDRIEGGAVRLTSYGQRDDLERGVQVECELVPGRNPIWGFGIASRSAIQLTGNARVEGVNDPSEANILSATFSTPEAFDLTGNVEVQGDIYAANPDAYVTLTGNVKIGGESLSGDIEEHIHIGEGATDFPEVDSTVFESFATNVVNKTTSTSGNKTFTNIRIAAGTNPTFSGNITIRGVIYVEAPNKVQFAGNLNFTGVLVTEDAGENAYETNTIKFAGNTSTQGVASLPDTPEFHELRQMPGSFLLAPGFGVEFTGNFGTVNGAMAADKFKWTGNAGGVVNGPIINYSDSDFVMTGNSRLRFNLSNSGQYLPGFTYPSRIAANTETYREL